jgi:hypothetical protein
MAQSNSAFLRELWRSKVLRWGGGSIVFLSAYDPASNQLGLPTLGAIIGMSGTLLPWWGWLLVAQALLVVALFEYVRRNTNPLAPTGGEVLPPNASAETTQQIAQLTERVAGLDDRLERIQENLGRLRRAHLAEKIEPDLKLLQERIKAAEDISPHPMEWPDELGREVEKLTMRLSAIEATTADIGIQAFDTGAERRKLVDEVKMDSANAILQAGEEQLWGDGRQKQRWFCHQAEMQAMRRAVAHLQHQLRLAQNVPPIDD